MTSKVKLSVIVPCYNEESRFRKGFNHYYSYFKKQNYSWELILVNDGSKDQTLNLMHKLAGSKNNVKIISYKTNRGKGFAVIQGVKAAKGQYILFTDIDYSVPIDTIESFYKYFKKGFPVVIGSRRVKGSKILVRQNLLRELLGRGFTFLVNLLIWGVHDATCGFKAFNKIEAKKVFQKITIYDWAFDAEILFICQKLGIKFIQVPVNWRDVRGTKVSLLRDVAKSLVGIFKICLNNFFGVYSK
ncbi:glycosyltransferase family 2 protein [Candidatus Curtissbacteria bacterium]|nr:glycosyltransferase family 2 protein [Candidatus Curtissbacteria bacterium]